MIRDLAEAVLIAALAAGFALALNQFSAKPLVITNPTGPGALPKKSSHITTRQLDEELKAGRALLLLDVRSVENWGKGHPASAVHLHFMEVVEQFPRIKPLIDASEGVVVMCDSEDCPNADGVVEELETLLAGEKTPKKSLRVLEGGWKSYSVSKLPIVAPAEGGK